MNYLPILAAAAEEVGQSHSVSSAVPHLLGMVLVIITLTALWGVCVLAARLINALAPQPVIPSPPAVAAPAPAAAAPAPAAAAPAPAEAAPAPAELVTGIPPEIIALITAAVASFTSTPHRIVSVRPQSSNWANAGRQSVLSSHRIR